MNHSYLSSRRTWCRALPLVLFGSVIAGPPLMGAKPGKEERREMKLEAAAAGDAPAKVKPPADDASTRALAKLREQMEVTDDAEWAVISERIAHLAELRRSVPGGFGFRAVSAGDKIKRSDRSAQQEQDALRTAVRDKLPDAEIKARLARAHDVHRQNEAKLEKAQEDLRAVLTVRQEAVAVVVGLLPP